MLGAGGHIVRNREADLGHGQRAINVGRKPAEVQGLGLETELRKAEKSTAQDQEES